MPVKGYTTHFCQDIKWLIRKDAPPFIEENLIPAISSSSFYEQNEPIKKGTRKSIWLFILPGGQKGEEYLIKRYLSTAPLTRLKNSITSSKAVRELKAAHAIAEKDIPTVTPLAVGEKGRWGMVSQGYVVLEKLKNCRDLNNYFLKEYPAAQSHRKLPEKWKIIREFGILARKVLNAGILQSDFSLNNFLLTKETTGAIKLYLSDFEKISIKHTLAFDQKVRCLAKLNRVGREISASDRLRFLKSYLAENGSKQKVSSFARTIQERTVEILKNDSIRGRITSVYTDALYERIEQNDIRGHYRKGYAVNEILDIIRRFDLSAKSLPSATVKHKEEIHMKLTCDGKVQPLKVVRYIPHLKTTSARTLWTKMSTLSMGGIPLDIPHVFLEMKVKSNQEGYLFIPERENEVPLGEFLKPSLGEKELSLLINLLVKLMTKLHYFGTFSDTISENDFSVVEKTEGPSIYLKNCEPFTIKKEVSLSEKKRDVAVLNALIKKHYPTMTYDLTRRYFEQGTILIKKS